MKRILQILVLSCMFGFITGMVIFVYGPTELFSDSTMSLTEITHASLKGAIIASMFMLVCVGGGCLTAWAGTRGKKFWIFPKKR